MINTETQEQLRCLKHRLDTALSGFIHSKEPVLQSYEIQNVWRNVLYFDVTGLGAGNLMLLSTGQIGLCCETRTCCVRCRYLNIMRQEHTVLGAGV